MVSLTVCRRTGKAETRENFGQIRKHCFFSVGIVKTIKMAFVRYMPRWIATDLNVNCYFFKYIDLDDLEG